MHTTSGIGSPTVRSRLRPLVSRAADGVRRQIGRVDDAEVRKARGLARAGRSGRLDVIYLGDSTSSWVAPYDQDRRPLDRMLADRLGEDVRFVSVHGGSYNPALHSRLLRVVDLEAHRPVVILPLCVRTRTVPWVEHPIYGRQRAEAFLATVDSATPLRRIRQGFPRPSPEEWADFHALPHPTWAGELTIGEYVHRLKSAKVRDEEWVRLLYAYHHGGAVPARYLRAVTDLGRLLRESGTDVVVYQTPVPVEKGSELHGHRFRELAEQNLDLLERAFTEGFGAESPVLRTGLDLGTTEFIDWRDGSEHVNEAGRLRLATRIGGAASAVLSERSAQDSSCADRA